jgi:hypothetical protein
MLAPGPGVLSGSAAQSRGPVARGRTWGSQQAPTSARRRGWFWPGTIHRASDSGGRRGNTPAGDEQQKLDGARALGLLRVASHGDLSDGNLSRAQLAAFFSRNQDTYSPSGTKSP